MTGTLNRKRLMYRYRCSSHFVSVNIEFITDMLRGVASPIRQAQNETSAMDTNSKDDYFAALCRKISYPTNGPKTYWTTLNKIINMKKMTNISPLLKNGMFITNFQAKADIFSELFVQQCSPNQNNSVLPRFIS